MQQLLLAGLLSLAAFTSAATSIYQQLPGHFGGFDSDSNIAVADEFQFGQTTSIGQLTWWGGEYSTPPAQDGFVVRFYSDNGGQPGNVLAQFSPGTVSKLSTGQFVNAPNLYPEYEYSLALPTPFVAAGGLTYWVSITNAPSNFWLWEASASPLNLGVQRSYNGGAWAPYDYNTAFQLAEVPEPGTIMFLPAALLGLRALHGRRGVNPQQAARA